jgi:Na+/melibiose symporter-like transporter
MNKVRGKAGTLSPGMIAGFGAGALGASLGGAVIPLLFLFYLTEFAQVPPAMAGLLLALPKLTDLVFDPWIGRKTDAWARRAGSRSSLIGLGAVALPVLLVLLFLPVTGLPLGLRIAFLAVLLVVQAMLLTVFAVAHTAIAGDLADDISSRSKLMASRALGQTIAGLAVSVAAPQLAAAFRADGGGYFGMAIVLAAAASLACAACLLAVRRVPLRAGAEDGAARALLAALKATLRNRDFYCIVLILILLGAGSTALFSAMPYANKHLMRGAPEQLSVLLTPVFLAVLAGAACAPWLAARVKTKTLLGNALVIALAGVTWFTGGPRTAEVMAVGGAVFGLAFGVLTVLISTLAMDTATRSHGAGESLGLYLGILFSAEKLGQSLGGIVMGFGLDWVGRLDATIAGANTMALDRLAVLWCTVPAVALLAALVMVFPLASRLHTS